MRMRLRRGGICRGKSEGDAGAKESEAVAPAARRVYKDESKGKGKSDAGAPAARRIREGEKRSDADARGGRDAAGAG